MTPEMESLKTRLKATWMSGDYAHFANYLEPGALAWLQRLEVGPGTRMLDVGCGAPARSPFPPRAGADVTGVDIASNLIAHAARTGPRAKACKCASTRATPSSWPIPTPASISWSA
ncbi:hypothetical protein LP419_36815 [Massilia sp. H-1]|nr:hypothetical protein LP419_36815 [Massilia sp. H-1]